MCGIEHIKDKEVLEMLLLLIWDWNTGVLEYSSGVLRLRIMCCGLRVFTLKDCMLAA